MTINLEAFARYYEGQPHQKEAFKMLQEAMPESLLQAKCAWVQKYREGPPHPSGIINPELMHQLTGYRAESFDQAFCDDFNLMLKDTGFDQDHEALKMLMANLMHESCNFLYMKEIASGSAYEGRSDLGNTQPGDGRKFKGCGPLQVTGRHHFERFAKFLKSKHGIDDPRIVAEGTSYVANKYPFEIAVSWITDNNLLKVCQEQGFEACCVRINGGTTGINDRWHKYEICKR